MSLLKEISGQVGRFNEVEATEVDAQIINSIDVNVIGTLVATNFQLPAVVPAGQRYYLAAGLDGLAEWAPASLDAFGQLAGSDNVSIADGDEITFSSTGLPVIGFTTFDLSAGYSYKKITLLVKLSNLMNTYNYYVHENYSINPIAPRQIISTLSVKF